MLKTQKQNNLMIIIYLKYVTITFMNIFDLSLQNSNQNLGISLDNMV